MRKNVGGKVSIWTTVKRWWQGIFPTKNIEQALQVKSVRSMLMQQRQELWRSIYIGHAPWNTDDIPSLMLAKAICNKVAKMVAKDFVGEIKGSPRADYLNIQYKRDIVTDATDETSEVNRFRSIVEMGCYNGTIILLPKVREGNIYTTIVENNCYLPLQYDEIGRLTGAVFIDTIIRDDKKYTLLEQHDYKNRIYTISYTAYVYEVKQLDTHFGSLGRKIELSEVEEWSSLEESTTFLNVDKPWYSVFTMPEINTVEQGAKEGSAIFMNAIDSLKKSDELEELINHEYKAGRLRQQASMDLFRKDKDGNPIMDADMFQVFDGIAKENFIDTYNPDFRIDAFNERMNGIKRHIEFVCGLAYGTISDVQIQAKTATEVLHGNADTSSTVVDLQMAWQKTLRNHVSVMDDMATAYGLAPQGKIEVPFWWDDSTVISKEEKQAQFDKAASQLTSFMGAGIVKPEVVLAYIEQNSGYYEKLTPEMIKEAAKNLPNAFDGGEEEE